MVDRQNLAFANFDHQVDCSQPLTACRSRRSHRDFHQPWTASFLAPRLGSETSPQGSVEIQLLFCYVAYTAFRNSS